MHKWGHHLKNIYLSRFFIFFFWAAIIVIAAFLLYLFLAIGLLG